MNCNVDTNISNDISNDIILTNVPNEDYNVVLSICIYILFLPISSKTIHIVGHWRAMVGIQALSSQIDFADGFDYSTSVFYSKLSVVLVEMANNKSPGPDGVTIAFIKCLWPMIGHEYHRMISKALDCRSFSYGIIQGLIELLYKMESRALQQFASYYIIKHII